MLGATALAQDNNVPQKKHGDSPLLRAFAGDALLYTVGAALGRCITLVSLLVLTRFLTVADYGLIDLVLVFVSLTTLSVCLEVTQGLAREFGEGRSRDALIRCSSTALYFTLAAGGTFFLAIMLFPTTFAGVFLRGTEHADMMRLAGAMAFASVVANFLQCQARWELRARLAVQMALLQTFAGVGLSVASVVWFDRGAEGVVGGQMAGLVISCIYGFIRLGGSFSLDFDRVALRRMLQFSIPLVPSSISVFALQYVDRYCLEYLGGLDYVGTYGVSQRFAVLLLVVLSGAQGAFLPLIMQNLHDPGIKPKMATSLRLFLLPALSATLALSLISPELVRLLTGPGFAKSADLVPLITLGVLLSQLTVFFPGIFIVKKTWLMILTNGSAALLSVVLNLTLIPIMGVLGAAVAFFGVMLFSLLITGAISQYYFRVPHQFYRLTAAAGLTSVLTLGALPVLLTFEPVSSMLLRGLVFLGGTLCLACLLVSRHEAVQGLALLRARVGRIH